MQNKYLSALKTKYASFGLSKEALDRVALQRVKTIANEDEIDSDIANSETMLLIMKEMQGLTDTQRNRATQVQKELDELKKKVDNQTPPNTQDTDSEVAKQLKELAELVNSMKAEKTAEQKKAKADAVLAEVHEKMKANGCTNDFIRNITLKGVEIADTDTADSLAEKYKSIYDQNCKDAYGEGYVPPRGNGNVNTETDNKAETEILQKRGLLPKSEN